MKLSDTINFLKTGIWKIDLGEQSLRRSFVIRLLRVMILTGRSLLKGKWSLRASALTYFSLLSVVPALALAFGVAKGFGLENTLRRELYEAFYGQEEILDRAVEFAHNLLDKVQGGVVAGLGLIFLFWAIFTILSQVEFALNDIWGVKRARPLGRRITDYLALMLIVPFVVIISGTITVYVSSQLSGAYEHFSYLNAVSPVIQTIVKLLPFVFSWLLFTYLYIFMPNTKINLLSGAVAGVMAGTLFQIFQAVYINGQIGISKYNAIYGSFAALPLFFIWLHFSWLIVLFGAEISCAYQNVETYEFEMENADPSHRFKRYLVLGIVQLLVQEFKKGGRDLTARKIAGRFGAPPPLVNQLLYELSEAGVISEVKVSEYGDYVYQPARDPETITVKSVIDAWESRGSQDFRLPQSEVIQEISKNLNDINELFEKSPANRRLKDF
jgi:membrane protein